MKNAILVSLMIILFSCGESQPENINLSGATLRSGYVYIELQNGGNLRVVQKSSPNTYAGGCTADGNWQQSGENIIITNIQSHCATQDYLYLNGTYTQAGKCINNGSNSFCMGPWADQK